MPVSAASEPIPLTTDEHGVVRVGGTRVTLDTVVNVYKAGTSAEEIARHYPALQLADVYAVITYYLRHREEVEGYLAHRQAEAEKIRAEIEEASDTSDLRKRLLERLHP